MAHWLKNASESAVSGPAYWWRRQAASHICDCQRRHLFGPGLRILHLLCAGSQIFRTLGEPMRSISCDFFHRFVGNQEYLFWGCPQYAAELPQVIALMKGTPIAGLCNQSSRSEAQHNRLAPRRRGLGYHPSSRALLLVGSEKLLCLWPGSIVHTWPNKPFSLHNPHARDPLFHRLHA